MKISLIPYMILLSTMAIMPSLAKECDSFDHIADGKAVSRMDLIDEWLGSQDMNCFGDADDTAYMGGSPLFDETTGKMRDRYGFILEKFPDEPWLDSAGGKPDEDIGVIDVVDDWLESENLNEYGDPVGTTYVGTSPLWDNAIGGEKDRYEYLLEKFPDKPWMVTLTSMDIIDSWLKYENLNEFGDSHDTVYLNGSPLWDSSGAGTEMDRYEYLLEKFPDKPWVQDIVVLMSTSDLDTTDTSDPDTTDSPNDNTPASGEEPDMTSGGFATQISITSLSLTLFLVIIAI